MLRLSHWAVLATLVIPVTHVQAQGLGRLVKKAKDKAADAAKALDPKKAPKDTARTTAADSTAGSGSGTSAPAAATATPSVAAPVPAPAPARAARVAPPAKPADTPLVLTDETYALFLPVLKADAERRRALLDYRKGITAYNTCKRKAMSEPNRSPSNKSAGEVE
jgi:hypothetical protein